MVTTLAVFMVSVDSNIITVALPKISSDFSAGFSILGWVVTGYLLALVALVLVSGKIGDAFGRKRIYLAGFAMFGFFSALCGLSQNIVELIAFRVLQGVSASFIFAVSRPLILDTFPPGEISFAFGVNTATSSIGAVIGPVIGGFLVALDWRLIFYVNVPVAILATLIGARNVPSGHGSTRDAFLSSSSSSSSSLRAGLGAINPLSSALLAIALVLLLTWLSFFDVRFGLAGALVLVPFAISESRSKNPLINRELRRNRGFISFLVAVSILTVGYSGIGFAMPFYFQSVENLSPQLTGILIAPISISLAVSSVAAGKFFGRMSRPTDLVLTGAGICAVGLISLGLAVGGELPVILIAALLFLVGIGVGLYWVPLVTSTMKLPRRDLLGAASGTWSMFVNLASAVSVAITVAISAYFLPQSLAVQVYSGGLINLTRSQAIVLKEGIAYALIALGAFNLVGIPILSLATAKSRTKT